METYRALKTEYKEKIILNDDEKILKSRLQLTDNSIVRKIYSEWLPKTKIASFLQSIQSIHRTKQRVKAFVNLVNGVIEKYGKLDIHPYAI